MPQTRLMQSMRPPRPVCPKEVPYGTDYPMCFV